METFETGGTGWGARPQPASATPASPVLSAALLVNCFLCILSSWLLRNHLRSGGPIEWIRVHSHTRFTAAGSGPPTRSPVMPDRESYEPGFGTPAARVLHARPAPF